MGRGYGRYWLIVLGIGLPWVGVGIWRILTPDRNGSPDSRLGIAIVVAAIIVIAGMLIALPIDSSLRRLRRENPENLYFLVHRSKAIVAALAAVARAIDVEPPKWTLWILVEVSANGLRLGRATTTGASLIVARDRIAELSVGNSTLDTIGVPAIVATVVGESSDEPIRLPFAAPTSLAFTFGWSEDKIRAVIEKADALFARN